MCWDDRHGEKSISTHRFGDLTSSLLPHPSDTPDAMPRFRVDLPDRILKPGWDLFPGQRLLHLLGMQDKVPLIPNDQVIRRLNRPSVGIVGKHGADAGFGVETEDVEELVDVVIFSGFNVGALELWMVVGWSFLLMRSRFMRAPLARAAMLVDCYLSYFCSSLMDRPN
jgi:hypothetical protein